MEIGGVGGGVGAHTSHRAKRRVVEAGREADSHLAPEQRHAAAMLEHVVDGRPEALEDEGEVVVVVVAHRDGEPDALDVALLLHLLVVAHEPQRHVAEVVGTIEADDCFELLEPGLKRSRIAIHQPLQLYLCA